jgi:inner membrane protein
MMNRKLLLKFVGVVFLTLLLLVPLMMVEGQIMERSSYQDVVKGEIARTAVGSQMLAGPVLAIRYQVQKPPETQKDEKTGKTVTRRVPPEERVLALPAERLEITGKASVEQRYRGIYQVRLYHLDTELLGEFSLPANLLQLKPEEGQLLGARAVLLFGMSDLRGIDSDPQVVVNDQTLRFAKPQDNLLDNILPGSRLEMELGPLALGQARHFTFAFPLKLTGTESFSIAPTAAANTIRLSSDWPHPSFQGSFLPRERKISPQGFDANWSISGLNLNFNLQQNVSSTIASSENGYVGYHAPESFSVEFMDPINIYLQSERAVKYGVLFIVLTFTAFFLWEILRRHPLHFVQYLLAGLALTIFFLLLIALSEHILFVYAYLISAVACIGLIVFYLSGVLGGRSPALAFGAGLVALYGALYGLIQSEDNALLMGSGLLFVALAAVMVSTRRLNWHKLGSADET